VREADKVTQSEGRNYSTVVARKFCVLVESAVVY
jgi:hypothetical protein